MSVVFKTFEVIEIDGIAAGNIVDVISNHASRRAEVLAAFGVYVAGLQTEINAEKVALEADKTQLTTDLATRTSERDSLQSQVTALISEKESLTAQVATLTTEKATLTSDLSTANATIATLTSEKTSLTTQVDSLTTQLETKTDELAESRTELQLQIGSLEAERIVLNTKIADLEQYRPFNPRILKGEAFYDRVSKEDMVTLLTSEDPQLVLVGKTIDAYRDNKWPVILDSTDFQQLVGYVLASAVFDQAEVDAVMKDGTREEAYTVLGGS